MTKPTENKDKAGRVLNFDHLIFWVGNAKATSTYFVTRFGFQPFAIREATEDRPVVSYAVKLNKIIIVFESPTTAGGIITKDLSAHGDFVKDVAFEVEDLDELVRTARDGGAEILKNVTEETDDNGAIRYAVIRTILLSELDQIYMRPHGKHQHGNKKESSKSVYPVGSYEYGDNSHTLIDRSKYSGLFWPGYQSVEEDANSQLLPDTMLKFIDHVEGNVNDGSLEDSVAWYEKNLNMQRFWCVDFVDYKNRLQPYSNISMSAVINKEETVLLSINEAAKGKSTSKVPGFLKALGSAGVEHIALHTDDIVATMRNLKARGAELVPFPAAYYTIIKKQLQTSSMNISESLDILQEYSILIDFDERGYLLQAFTKHLQARATVFIEVIQRKNHRGFGSMNYKWVFEALELQNSKAEKTNGESK